MRIAWIHERADLAGGAERYVRDTAQLLGARGITSSLLHWGEDTIDPEIGGAFHAVERIRDLPLQIRDLAPDLLYVHQLPFGTSAAPLLALGIPAARFFHDHRLFCLRDRKYTTLRHRCCTRTVGWRCYPCLGFLRRSTTWPGVELSRLGRLRAEQRENMRFDTIVVGSSYMAAHVVAHGFDPERVRVIPPYACPPEEPTSGPERRESDLLLFVGALVRGKGLDVLLDALTRLRRPARLLVVGTGRQESEYRARARTLRLDDRVRFVGRVERRELYGYYRAARCVVLPSRNPETFGLIGPEAMSQGTPVIATRVGGIEEWLENGRTGLTVAPGRSEELARAIDRVLGNPELAERLGAQARRRFFERFLPDRHLEGLIALLEALLARRRVA